MISLILLNMNIGEIFLVGLGVSLDVMAVSFSIGNIIKKNVFMIFFLIAFIFGFFQMIMPIIGFFLGINIFFFITLFTNVISFIVFGFLGINMICESFEKNIFLFSNFNVYNLIVIAVSTSIDALVIGVSLSCQINNILFCALVFFVVTFVTSVIGLVVGKNFSDKYSFKSKFFGGIILLMIGIKYLIKFIIGL